MNLLPLVEEFARAAGRLSSPGALHATLSMISTQLGFRYFALTHHVDMLRIGQEAIRLHNYPDSWAEFFDRNSLGVSDPVHRASHLTGIGFAWSQVPRMISLTPGDHQILSLAGVHGIGEGFTVPTNVPGEANGSVSFATMSGQPLPEEALSAAQLVGAFAFESARRLWRMRDPVIGLPRLTDRQRDCLIWVARGKSDWEISRIIDISQETVVRHVKQARERYGVQKRTLLLIRTLFDGTISFADVFRR
ncbi:LuxR family transcriptional regulator [Sphingomonas sp. So64.6b]|uniref:LuxR family transcriptional regulator n=1 Tax=Sphingomonas sp. So64.6b TaxID=2997354 RepID=UPI0015FFB01B|nr:LuxR family transcriptional regulator [Sphingomonas sp. So64.6b]QNA83758.1 LuxR family transcriptional regulator [Sphingomonas sp. So64.6b]